jgi:hypothetical protein
LALWPTGPRLRQVANKIGHMVGCPPGASIRPSRRLVVNQDIHKRGVMYLRTDRAIEVLEAWKFQIDQTREALNQGDPDRRKEVDPAVLIRLLKYFMETGLPTASDIVDGAARPEKSYVGLDHDPFGLSDLGLKRSNLRLWD